ncbi:Spherulation-specific family 4-domain-containing protein [Mycena sp. CBHHK59/15]|nr:Spherulation-specific family 4-domain-containing protein [Mycena sp. CBHHK59/15]
MLSYGISILLIQLFVVPGIHALGVLLPLYIYPGTNCAAWSPVSDAISAHPNTPWYIIINPDSGPGSPDQQYQTCVSALPPSENQITLGYIDNKSGNVVADIDTYAGWDSSSRPTGIYFDNISPTANQLSTYQNYVSHAKSQGFTFIGLDPGQTTDPSYFPMADLVNTYEDSYSSFNPDSLSGTISKQSVTLVNAPATGSYSTVISRLESLGVGAVYITNLPDSSQDFPSQLSEFVGEVASVGGVSTSSGSSSGSTSSGTNSSGTTSSGSTSSGSTSSGSASPGHNTPDSSNPNSSAVLNPSSKAGSASASSKSPSPSLSKSSSQSTALKGDLATSSIESSVSSPSGVTNQPTSATHHGPPIAAIVGGVLGVLVLLLVMLVIFMCMRRRRRHPEASPEAVAPFTVNHNAIPMGSESSPMQSWNNDAKAPLTIESTVVETATLTDTNFSTRASYPSTARLSAAPTYGTAWESLRGSMGPPPSYHN